jgi:hypothetical protein
MIKSYWVPTSLQSDRSASWADEEETELLANDSGVSCSAGWVRKGLVTANPVAGVDKPGPVRGESGSCPMPRSGSFARPPGPDQLRRSPVASPTLQGVQTPETLNRHRMKVQWQVKSMPIAHRLMGPQLVLQSIKNPRGTTNSLAARRHRKAGGALKPVDRWVRHRRLLRARRRVFDRL